MRYHAWEVLESDECRRLCWCRVCGLVMVVNFPEQGAKDFYVPGRDTPMRLSDEPECHDWRTLALYLADCHAATTEDLGSLTSTSQRVMGRLRSICGQILDVLDHVKYVNARPPGRVCSRLRSLR